jgi:hypothetical protein
MLEPRARPERKTQLALHAFLRRLLGRLLGGLLLCHGVVTSFLVTNVDVTKMSVNVFSTRRHEIFPRRASRA